MNEEGGQEVRTEESRRIGMITEKVEEERKRCRGDGGGNERFLKGKGENLWKRKLESEK